ncbi:unnamed protein product [Prunus armeniaca]
MLPTRKPANGSSGPTWKGPYRVIDIVCPGTYRLRDLRGANLPHPCNAEHIKNVAHGNYPVMMVHEMKGLSSVFAKLRWMKGTIPLGRARLHHSVISRARLHHGVIGRAGPNHDVSGRVGIDHGVTSRAGLEPGHHIFFHPDPCGLVGPFELSLGAHEFDLRGVHSKDFESQGSWDVLGSPRLQSKWSPSPRRIRLFWSPSSRRAGLL